MSSSVPSHIPSNGATILVTGATGQLGQLVLERLRERASASRVVAMIRDTSKAGDLQAAGVETRVGDYTKPETLAAAFDGIDTLLLISSNALGSRVAEHRNVIDAAKHAGVTLLVYTSILHADRAEMNLAKEHMATETLIRESGIPYVFLRNGWYTENYTGSLAGSVAHGAMVGSAGPGRIAAASRRDFADAAVAVLTSTEDQSGRIYELAGDESFTMPEFAAEVARQSGKPVVYHDLSEQDNVAALKQFGLPEPLAVLLANSDIGASKGELEDDGRQLSALIGRPTTRWQDSIRDVLA